MNNIIYNGNGDRIDKYLTIELNKSRTEVQNLLKNGKILVNNKIVKPSYILNNNDAIMVEEVAPVVASIEKKAIDLDIIYEDKDVIVVNKASGMVVHPANGHYDDTLVNALMYHCTDLSTINGEIRPGIVHRIDKDTSGLLVACKNDYAHNFIAKQLKDKTTIRKYVAIVYGTFDHLFGKINAPIARDPQNRKKMAVVEGGKEAITHFKVIEKLGGYTLIECQLETGRTHQIRVHMSYINHPVLGDPLYGPKKQITEYGQYLHAKTLGFIHPSKNELVEFDSSLPKEFEEKLTELRNLIK